MKHNRHQVKHFNKEGINYLEEYPKEKFKNDIPNSTLQTMLNHSDNVSQYFRSTGNLEFFSRLQEDQGGPGKCVFVYSSGTPGHGKGSLDGLGLNKK